MTTDESMGDGGAGVRMPTGILSGSGNDSEVGQTLIMNDDNPFTYGNENDTTSIGTGVVTFKLSTPGTKNEVPVSNTTEPIEIYLGTSATLLADPKLYTLILRQGDSQSSMVYHPINVTNNDTTIHMVVRPEMRDSEDLFDILIQYESRPNDTNYMVQTTLPHPEDAFTAYNLTWEKEDEVRHTFFPDAELTRLAGILVLLIICSLLTYYHSLSLLPGVAGKVDLSSEETMFNYTYRHFLGGCRFWNHENETWESDGCMVHDLFVLKNEMWKQICFVTYLESAIIYCLQVGNLTTYNATQCLCTHLTSFGGEMVVPPNTIDFNNVWAKFKDLNENAAVFSTIVSLLGVYVIGLIWARHMDKKDLIKWGATPLEDNLPTDNYHYQVSVYTGMKKNSGTKSSISFILSGEVHDTGVRRMFDGKRQTHGKGSIMNYVLSVEQKLGPLSFCRVWHDNSGDSAWRSWYLEQIEVSDLQTGEKYFFLCNRWLACEEDDGMVDRILPVASIEDLVAFKQLFSSSVRKKLSSDHLWLSVFSRPTRSSFTRVQRISCCMSLLFLTMITNAMWFKSDGEKGDDSQKQVVSMSIGPITFTLSQIFISLASTIIVFPPSFLLITLFRRTKQKKNTVMQANQTKPKRGKWKNLGTSNSLTNMWGPEPKESKFKKFKESINELVKGGNKNKYDPQEEDFDSIPAPTIAGDPNAKKIRAKKKKKPFMFPHWCNYIAWVCK
ncbi:PK1L2-like protein [Mya arenaria]|uniref:PK1L2-like protein n=1 Tax=Mya arenaria TaxID=6604 RepID=A0ABY7DLN0_MYAAR|nr:PK1L2-like protein [Mya arenaria]